MPKQPSLDRPDKDSIVLTPTERPARHQEFSTDNTQTAVINIINLRIIYKLDVSYASQHTFSKVTVTIF